jgi:hypothetical protein
MVRKGRHRNRSNLNKEQKENDMNDMRFTDRMFLQLPSGTNDLLKTVARRRFTKPSEFVRQAILKALAEEGVCLAPLPATTERAA